MKKKCGEKYKCPRSTELYTVEPYTDDEKWNKYSAINATLKYSNICPNDPKFYIVCGHVLSAYTLADTSNFELVFCETYACLHQGGSYSYKDYNPYNGTITFDNKILSGVVNFRYADCNNQLTCANTQIDEAACPADNVYVCHGETKTVIDASKVCDLSCDCYRCNDEAICNNHTYGVMCNSTRGLHIHAFFFFFSCGQPLVKYRLEYPCQRVPLLLPTRNAGTPKI